MAGLTTLPDSTDFNNVGFVATARPVFVVGAPRSGVSLLTLSLGQHVNLLQVIETNWFERLAIGLQHAYTAGIAPRETSQLDASGVGVSDFSAYFGDAVNRLVLGSIDDASTRLVEPQPRWLDGSASHAQHLYPIMRLFPRAKVIHVFREVEEVVASLTNTATKRVYKTRFTEHEPDEAIEQWVGSVNACVEAERAYGSDTVMRVRRQDLVARPEEVIGQCLAFIDEPFDRACLRAFRPLEREANCSNGQPSLRVVQQRVGVPPRVAQLSKELFDEGTPCYLRDEQLVLKMELAFGEWCDREQRAIKNVGHKTPKSGSSPKESVRSRRILIPIRLRNLPALRRLMKS